jgi:hypothetical protein
MDPKPESAGASFFDWATLTPRDAFTVLRTAPKVLGPWSDLGPDHRTGDVECRRSVDGRVVARQGPTRALDRTDGCLSILETRAIVRR